MPIPLRTLVSALDGFAPPRLAASWDNTGLLVEPPDRTLASGQISAVLLTIDLTEGVLDEALELGADAIVSYHPPLFRGVKRLTQGTPGERTLLRCIQHGVAVHAPHTRLDSVAGGMTDWLIRGAGAVDDVRPIEPIGSGDDAVHGLGRLATLREPTPFEAVVERLKAHLGLPHVRVAVSERHRAGAPIETLAACPGAGGSLFEGLGDVDLLLTGEMRHHDVLARAGSGTSVVLTDHTNTERGYLPEFAELMRRWLDADVPVHVSTVDRDPLAVV